MPKLEPPRFAPAFLATLCLALSPALAENLSQGLLATFSDAERSVTRVVALPELGLDATESPHPAIKPAFRATFEGFLEIKESGTYRFKTPGALEIAGKPVTDTITLEAGRHPLKLALERPPGPTRFGLTWQSERFIEEPMPPTALWHQPPTALPETSGAHPSPLLRIASAIESLKCATCHDAPFLATMHHKFAPDSLLPLMRHASQPRWYGAMTVPNGTGLSPISSEIVRRKAGWRTV